MTWEAGTYYAAICDRCGHELEDPDTGGTALFEGGQQSHLNEYWGWHEVRHDDGTVELVCVSCWDELGADNPAIAGAAVERARFDQTGPDLLESES